nr:DALR domain-containing protein [Sphingobacterium sp. T2]
MKSSEHAAMPPWMIDFNSPVLIAELFEVVRLINSIYDGKQQADENTLNSIKQLMNDFVFDILGLRDDQLGADSESVEKLMDLIIKLRNEAKQNKDYATSDRIRNELAAIGIQLKDSKEGTIWNKI